MTVNTVDITSGPYTGNGTTADYSYTFRIDDKSQLAVYETTDLGVKTLLTVDTDYTVSGIGNDAGGIITRVAGNLPTDYIWYIRSDYKNTQLTAFRSQGAFKPDVHESAMDKLTFLIQQLQDAVDRSMRLAADVDYSGVSVVLPEPIAGYTLAWNETATALVNQLFKSAGDLTVSAFIETVLDDADAGEVLDTLGVTAFVQTLLDDTDAATARATLGAAALTVANTFTKANVFQLAQTFQSSNVYSKQQGIAETELTDAANISWDLDTNQEAKVTLDGNRTLDNPTNQKAGYWYHLRVIQDAVTGTRTLSYGTAYKFGDLGAPILSTAAGEEDLLAFRSNGTYMQYMGVAPGVHA